MTASFRHLKPIKKYLFQPLHPTVYQAVHWKRSPTKKTTAFMNGFYISPQK